MTDRVKLTANQLAALSWMAGTGGRGARAFHAKFTHRDGRKSHGAGRTMWSLNHLGLVAWVDDDARTGWVVTASGRARAGQ